MVGRLPSAASGGSARGFTLVELAIGTAALAGLLMGVLGIVVTVAGARNQSSWADHARTAAVELLAAEEARPFEALVETGPEDAAVALQVRGVDARAELTASNATATVAGGWAPAWVDLTATVYPNEVDTGLAPVTATRRVEAGDLVSGSDKATVTVAASGAALANVGDVTSLPQVRLVNSAGDAVGSPAAGGDGTFGEDGVATLAVANADEDCTADDPCRVAIGPPGSLWSTAEWTVTAASAAGSAGHVVVGPGEQARHAIGLARTSAVEVRLFAQPAAGQMRVSPSESGSSAADSGQVCLWARFSVGLHEPQVVELCNDEHPDVLRLDSYEVPGLPGQLALPGRTEVELFGAHPDSGELPSTSWGRPGTLGAASVQFAAHEQVSRRWPAVGHLDAPDGDVGAYELTWTWPNGGPAVGPAGFTIPAQRAAPTGAFAHLPLDEAPGRTALFDRAAGDDFGTASAQHHGGTASVELGAPGRSADGATSARLSHSTSPTLLLDMRAGTDRPRTTGQVDAVRLREPLTFTAAVLPEFDLQQARTMELAGYRTEQGAWTLTVDTDSGHVQFQVDGDTVQSDRGALTGGVWQDLAVTVDPADGGAAGAEVRFVVDGHDVGGGTLAGYSLGTADQVEFGRRIEGNLAHLALFDQALDAATLRDGWFAQMNSAATAGGVIVDGRTWATPAVVSGRSDCLVDGLAGCPSFDESSPVPLHGVASLGDDVRVAAGSTLVLPHLGPSEPGRAGFTPSTVAWRAGDVAAVNGSTIDTTVDASRTTNQAEPVSVRLPNTAGTSQLTVSRGSYSHTVHVTRYTGAAPTAAVRPATATAVHSQRQLADDDVDLTATVWRADGQQAVASNSTVSVSPSLLQTAAAGDSAHPGMVRLTADGTPAAGDHDLTLTAGGVDAPLRLRVHPTVDTIELDGAGSSVLTDGTLTPPVTQGSLTRPEGIGQFAFTVRDLAGGDVTGQVPVRVVAAGGPAGTVNARLHDTGQVHLSASDTAPAWDGYQAAVRAGGATSTLTFAVEATFLNARIEAPSQARQSDGPFDVTVTALDGSGTAVALPDAPTLTTSPSGGSVTLAGGPTTWTAQLDPGAFEPGGLELRVPTAGGNTATHRVKIDPAVEQVTLDGAADGSTSLPAGSTLTLGGRVTDAAGNAAAGVEFDVTVEPDLPSVRGPGQVVSDRDGNLQVPVTAALAAPDGSYTVTVAGRDGGPSGQAAVTVNEPVADVRLNGPLLQGRDTTLEVTAEAPDGTPAEDLQLHSVELIDPADHDTTMTVGATLAEAEGGPSGSRARFDLAVADPGPIAAGTWLAYLDVSHDGTSGRLEVPVRVAGTIGSVDTVGDVVEVGQNQTRTVVFDVRDLAGDPLGEALVDVTLAAPDGMAIGPGSSPAEDDARDHVRVRTAPSGRGQVAVQVGRNALAETGTLTFSDGLGEAVSPVSVQIQVAATVTRLSASTVSASVLRDTTGPMVVCAFDIADQPAAGVTVEVATADLDGPRAVPVERTLVTGEDGCGQTRFRLPSTALPHQDSERAEVQVSAGTVRGIGRIRLTE